MLDGVLSVLEWRGEADALDRPESAYTSLLSKRLGFELRRLDAERPGAAARAVQLLSEVDAPTLRRVVIAPETCSRLIWGHPGGCDDRDLWEYLTDSLEVELDRAEPASGPAARRWSALGDLRLEDGAVVAQPGAPGLVIDAQSPAALCFDYSTLHRGGMRLRHYEDPDARSVALGRIAEAMGAIDDLDASLGEFVRRFTLVANLVVDADSPKFSSGSTAQYVGRSLFCNAHLESADLELLAESLVHEAIHSLLYMHEMCEPWVVDPDRFAEDTEVESPWSGATLVVRPFLQACFVWFGLAHFWRRADGHPAFRPQRVEERLATARRGFLDGPLPDRIPGQVAHIAPEVLELVAAMQAAVVSQHETESIGGRSASA